MKQSHMGYYSHCSIEPKKKKKTETNKQTKTPCIFSVFTYKYDFLRQLAYFCTGGLRMFEGQGWK